MLIALLLLLGVASQSSSRSSSRSSFVGAGSRGNPVRSKARPGLLKVSLDGLGSKWRKGYGQWGTGVSCLDEGAIPRPEGVASGRRSG